MNLKEKIIITDTNIITDLDTAFVLEDFVNLDNVYISDLVKRDEINYKTGNIDVINNFKVICSSEKEIIGAIELSKAERKLSIYDLNNYILARDNNGILATGDNKLKLFAEKNNVEVIRTLKVISYLKENGIITTGKAINGLMLLKNSSTCRIPSNDIDNLINKFNKELEFTLSYK